MEQWKIAVIGLAICIAAILVVSGIKMIAKKIAEVKKKELNMNKAEYPLAIASTILAYGGVLAFLYFGVMQDIGTALKLAGVFAGSTQTLYVFIVQASRKGIKGIVAGIITIINKIRGSKKPVEELPEIIDEATEQVQDADTDTTDELGKTLYNAIFKK